MINSLSIKRLVTAFLIAFVFWFFIKSEDNYSVNLRIPLEARNLQEQKTYKEEVPESIIVTLKGSGRSFIWLSLFKNFYDDFKAVIDLSSISDEYNFELNSYYKQNPEKIVLPQSLSLEFVEVISPRQIEINLDRYLVKKIPIKSNIIPIIIPGNIIVGEIQFNPDSVSMGGPEEVVNLISHIETFQDTIDNLDREFVGEIQLSSPDKLVDFSPKRVNYKFDIQPISETIVSGIPVQLKNKPTAVNVFVNPSTVSLTIVGGLNQITRILPSDIQVIIDFEKDWKADKQFYSPEIIIPKSLIEWKNLSPNNLEILVIKEIN
jgi:YbbR domain-containing protein